MPSYIITLDGITLVTNTTVRNLGVIFNQDTSFDSLIKQVSRTALAGLPKPCSAGSFFLLKGRVFFHRCLMNAQNGELNQTEVLMLWA